MFEALIGVAVGLVAAGALWFFLGRRGGMQIESRTSLMQMRSVGELVVFRLVTQQIVTAEQHMAGRFKDGRKWLVSVKKIALIIEYGIDFKYDLRSRAFRVEELGEASGRYRLVMPPCDFQTHIRDIKFYDEQNARLLPWLLGDLVEALGPGFDEQDKNKLMEAARTEADERARLLVEQLQTEAQSSARQTLEAMARGFGAADVEIDFADSPIGEKQPTEIAPKIAEQASAQGAGGSG